MGHPFEQRYFATADGAPIGYQVAGRRNAPKVLLCNGLGGNYNAFQPLADALGDRYRFAAWDYRGLFTSAPPRAWGVGPRRVAAPFLRVDSHARDGLEMLTREGYERFPLIGWSMGVQVGLELYRMIGDRISMMILLNGISGRVYDTVLGPVPGTKHWMPRLLRLLQVIWPVAQGVVTATARWERFLDVGIKLSVLDPGIDRVAARKVLRDFGTLDMHLYMTQLRILGDHDATPVLRTIRCPTLVIAGDNDLFTPGWVGRQMAEAIPDCTVRSFPRGSHYAPIEFASEINGEVERFLAERS